MARTYNKVMFSHVESHMNLILKEVFIIWKLLIVRVRQCYKLANVMFDLSQKFNMHRFI